jgi:putative phosphoribosyl transferase
MAFADRAQAGRRLARRLEYLRGQPVVVLGLPRGGVPVAREVAAALGAPLDVIVVRKLGVPFQPELAMGAVGEDGVRVVDDDVVRMAGVTDDEVARVEGRERRELERRARRFRGGRARAPLEGRVAVVVDDGIATGSTARAACRAARARGATRVVLAVPVAPPGWVERLGGLADDYVCLGTPASFFAVGQFYDDFSQTTDEQVVARLRDGDRSPATTAAAAGDDPPGYDGEVTVTAGSAVLHGHLMVPERPDGLVVFAHGSGSSRHSPRNRFVATVLNEAGLGTLLLDLLTSAEERDRARVFDIDLLAGRLLGATGWVRSRAEAAGLRVGYFGASTGSSSGGTTRSCSS